MTLAAKQLQLFFSGSVSKKRAVAHQYFKKYGSELLCQENIISGLTRIREAGAALQTQMNSMQMGRLCSTCATQPNGGCCSNAMADNTDAVLLLINQLMGNNITFHAQHTTDECCYLGQQGCNLQVKPIFCLNYNCTHIQEKATTAQMDKLEKKAAVLLHEQTALETDILTALHKWTEQPTYT